jgi:hypothetical protein
MNDHYHQSHEIYGLENIRQDTREALSLIDGLREDLSRAEQHISDLEGRIEDLEEATGISDE